MTCSHRFVLLFFFLFKTGSHYRVMNLCVQDVDEYSYTGIGGVIEVI